MGGYFAYDDIVNIRLTLARSVCVYVQEALSLDQAGRFPAPRGIPGAESSWNSRCGSRKESCPAPIMQQMARVNAPALTYIDRLPPSAPSARSMSKKKGKRSLGLNSYH